MSDTASSGALPPAAAAPQAGDGDAEQTADAQIYETADDDEKNEEIFDDGGFELKAALLALGFEPPEGESKGERGRERGCMKEEAYHPEEIFATILDNTDETAE
eukprot:14774439-Heterocapsa_arctica.AAC.1